MSSPPATQRAIRQAAGGKIAEAVALLTAAGDQGDAAALMEHAIWHLTGVHIPRDVAAARVLLRRAVAIGHADGALMEVALTANGSGGVADWAAAMALLRIAARNDPVAQRQLHLLAAMDIDAAGAPRSLPSAERLSKTPDVVRFRRLLSPDECAHIAGVVQPILQPSDVVDPATGRKIEHPIRTSDGAVIGPTREDLVIRALNRRIAAISDTEIDQGEALSVLRYRPHQQYRTHHDALGGVAQSTGQDGAAVPQRRVHRRRDACFRPPT